MENKKILEFLENVVKNQKLSVMDRFEDNIYAYYSIIKGNTMIENITIVYNHNNIIDFHIVRFTNEFEDYNKDNFEKYCEKYL